MFIVKECLGKVGKVFTNDLPKPAKLGLGRFLCSIVEAYASATWTAYGTAIGFHSQAPRTAPPRTIANDDHLPDGRRESDATKVQPQSSQRSIGNWDTLQARCEQSGNDA